MHADSTSQVLTLDGLRSALSTSLNSTEALIIPLAGKRIVAPRAQWGKVVTDYGVIHWTKRMHLALQAAVTLRELGFNETGLREDSPPFVVLGGLDVALHDEVRRLWDLMKPIRRDKTLLPLFLFASRKATKP